MTHIFMYLSIVYFIFSACGKIHSRRQNSSLVFQLRYVVFSLCRLKTCGIYNSDTFLWDAAHLNLCRCCKRRHCDFVALLKNICKKERDYHTTGKIV